MYVCEGGRLPHQRSHSGGPRDHHALLGQSVVRRRIYGGVGSSAWPLWRTYRSPDSTWAVHDKEMIWGVGGGGGTL